MYYRYFLGFTNPAGAEPDGAEFSLVGDELVYAFPSDAGTTCVALSVNLGDFAAMHHDAERVFHERLAAHPGLAPRLARCTLDGRLLGCGPKDHLVRVPAGRGGRSSATRRSTRTRGPATAWTTPGVHATFLAAAIDDWLAGRVSEAEAFARYHAQRDEHALADFRETVELGRDLRQLANA